MGGIPFPEVLNSEVIFKKESYSTIRITSVNYLIDIPPQ